MYALRYFDHYSVSDYCALTRGVQDLSWKHDGKGMQLLYQLWYGGESIVVKYSKKRSIQYPHNEFRVGDIR